MVLNFVEIDTKLSDNEKARLGLPPPPCLEPSSVTYHTCVTLLRF